MGETLPALQQYLAEQPVNMFKMTGSDSPQPVRNHENITFNLAAEYPINKQWVLLLEMYSTWTW